MTRHGKNSTASAVYSYHERQKDTKSSGYGSKSVRLGKDSVKDFDCCCLTLQPCRDPVITRDGYLYDREAILECMLHQKTEGARKLKAFEKQKKKLEAEIVQIAHEKEQSKVESFVQMEKRITTKPSASTEGASASSAEPTPPVKGELDFPFCSGSLYTQLTPVKGELDFPFCSGSQYTQLTPVKGELDFPFRSDYPYMQLTPDESNERQIQYFVRWWLSRCPDLPAC